MPYLNLSLLGLFLATVSFKPLTRFRTKTAQALLIYLTREHEIDYIREKGHRLLMQALTLSGRRAEAMAQFKALEWLIEQELRAKPSLETTELYEAILEIRIHACG